MLGSKRTNGDFNLRYPL